MSQQDDGRALSGIIADALTQLSMLAQTEIQLARAEIGQKAAAAAAGVTLIGIAAVFAIPALLLLLLALAMWIATLGLGAAAANAIVGAGALVLAIVLVAVGLSRLSARALKPEHTLHQLRRDALIVKERLT